MSTTVSPELEPAAPARRPWYRRRRWIISLSVVFVLLLAAGGGIWWFLRDDAPSEVDLETATQSLDTAPDDTTPATSGATVAAGGSTAGSAGGDAAAPTASVTGTWQVDTSIGEFSFEDSTGTFVGFRVQEELSGIGSTTAVGRTPTVAGTIAIDDSTLSEAVIEADMTALSTNDSRRDDNVQDALETGEFPTATFTLTEPIDLGGAVESGETTSIDATGDLTIHGVATSVTLPLEAQVIGDNVVVVGSLDIVMSDYGVEAPRAPIVVSVSDEATIELQLFFSQA